MRRVGVFLLLLLLLLPSVPTASAATGISSGSLSATASSTGVCQITLDLQIQVDSPSPDMTFPLPKEARSITVNGSTARTQRRGDVLEVKLSSVIGNAIGSFPIRLQYTLPDIVSYNEAGKLMLTLPLLSGYDFPIETLDFYVTLPGEFTTQPSFSSGYYQQSIESKLTFRISGNSISGQVVSSLIDKETLAMSLEVTDSLFPHAPIAQWSMGWEVIAMIVLGATALLYWLLFLRCLPFLPKRCTAAPEGFTAGELACGLTGAGMDLTMMVLSWAQLGYILIHSQDSGRVTLHKRMEMGNERSATEQKIFRKLFGKRLFIDGTGYHYANLFHKTATAPLENRGFYKRSLGRPRIFRGICAGIGVFGGISLGIALVGSALLGVLLIAILAIFGGCSAWLMQDWVKGLHLRDKSALVLALGLGLIWLLLGSLSGILPVTASMVAAQLLGGFALAYGKRRTPLGRQTAGEILGLRRYLRKLSPEQAQRLCRSAPDYFFSLAPYAKALGVLTPFAKSFRGKRLPTCPYLTTGMDGHMTALEWSQVMDRAVQALDARQKRLPLERLLGR